MWFAGTASPADYPWTRHLVWKLLYNDAGTVGLFARNPFPGRLPRYIRAVRYRYVFAPPTPRANGSGASGSIAGCLPSPPTTRAAPSS